MQCSEISGRWPSDGKAWHRYEARKVPPQVLHTRSCSGMGMHFVRFLVACYLAFNMDYSSVTLALASLPPTAPPRRLLSGESSS